MSATAKRTSNGIGLRNEMEARRLGLNASGSYVLSSLETGELDHLNTVNFINTPWREDESVLVVRGTQKRGWLVRFVNLSLDGSYCRFPGKFRYLSPRLLETDPVSIKDFVVSIAKNPTLHVHKHKDKCKYFGLLVGPRHAGYKSLVTLKGDRLVAIDIEENAPGHSTELTTVLADNPPEAELIRREIVGRFGT